MSSDPKVTFYAFAKSRTAPHASAYCQKIETYFRASPTLVNSYKYVGTQKRSPKGKLPWITVADDTSAASPTVVADSHFITKYLVEHDITQDLDAGLTPVQRADSRAYQSWTEGVMYPALTSTRWLPSWPHNYQARYDMLPIPAFLKPVIMWFVRRKIITTHEVMGVGKHSKEEVESLLQEWVDGVSARLGDGEKWFHGGEEPTNVDVILSSFLMQVGHQDHAEFVAMVSKHEGLLRYTERAVEKWFPEYEALLKKLQEMRG